MVGNEIWEISSRMQSTFVALLCRGVVGVVVVVAVCGVMRTALWRVISQNAVGHQPHKRTSAHNATLCIQIENDRDRNMR